MPTPGYYFRDGGTTPLEEKDQNDEFRRRITTPKRPATASRQAPLGQETSTSHILATQDHELQGAAQQAGKEDFTSNLGWQNNAKGVDTLVGGIDNDDLWILIRRFNKARNTFCWASHLAEAITNTCSANLPYQSHPTRPSWRSRYEHRR